MISFPVHLTTLLSKLNLVCEKRLLKINSGIQFSCDLKPVDSSWAVLKVLLPIYCGAIYCRTQADISISETDNKSTYLIRRDINSFGKLKYYHIFTYFKGPLKPS